MKSTYISFPKIAFYLVLLQYAIEFVSGTNFPFLTWIGILCKNPNMMENCPAALKLFFAFLEFAVIINYLVLDKKNKI